MAFTILNKGTTITASEVNDNFYHIGLGDLMPRGGSSLEETTGVYGIGSDVYKWSNAYINNIYCDDAVISDANDTIRLLYSHFIDEINSSTARITVSGLSDVTKLQILFNQIEISWRTMIFFNGDSNTSNYISQGYSYATTVSRYNASSTATPYVIPPTSITSPMYYYGNCFVQMNSNIDPQFEASGILNTDEYSYKYISSVVKYSSSTITSLSILGNFHTGASIQIWEIQ